MSNFEIQPLRIPNCWAIVKNDLYELPKNSEGKGGKEYLEDEMFVAVCLRTGTLLEFGYVPPYRTSGTYRIRLVRPYEVPSTWSWPLGNVDRDWSNAEVKFESKDRFESIKRLEELLLEINLTY